MECYKQSFALLVLMCCISLTLAIGDILAVRNPNVTTISSTALRVTWDAYTFDTGTVNYTVIIVTSELRNSMRTITFQAVNNTNQSIEINNLFPYTLYEITIAGTTRFNEVIAATRLNQRTTAAFPSGPPLSVISEAISFNQINVTWSVNLRNVNGLLLAFNIYYTPANMAHSTIVVYNVTLGDIGPYAMQIGDLSANIYYDVSVSIVNNIGEGMKSATKRAKTFPRVPVNNNFLPMTPVSSTPTTVLVQIPAQPLFATADIAVIYILVDINTPPVLTNHSSAQIYNPVSSSQDGDVPLNGAAANSIRIQAVFGPSHFNIQNDYFEFNVGDGAVTTYSNLTVINTPLDPSITYHISFYILFNDKNGQTSASSSLITELSTVILPTESPNDSCLSCFLPSVIVFAVIIGITITIVLSILIYCVYCTRFQKVSLPVVRRFSLPVIRKFSLPVGSEISPTTGRRISLPARGNISVPVEKRNSLPVGRKPSLAVGRKVSLPVGKQYSIRKQTVRAQESLIHANPDVENPHIHI